MKQNSNIKTPIVKLIDDISKPHNSFLLNLSIDPSNFTYKNDENFTLFRNQMFILTPNKKFLLLDINFLIDYLYKTQVFALNLFFKSRGLKNFLSLKGENFTEKTYLKIIMQKCFPKSEIFCGNNLVKNDKNSLIDFCIKQGNKILLIEFKDTLLSSLAKNSANPEIVFKALDIKFSKNQFDAPKGIQQLSNAIDYLDKNRTELKRIFDVENPEIFPIVIYTDNTFGYDGVNKIFKEKFKILLEENRTQLNVENATFINLNLFEIQENYIRNGKLNVFDLIKRYHSHTRNPNFSTTPFEVFAVQFKRAYVSEDLGLPSLYLETCNRVKNELLLR